MTTPNQRDPDLLQIIDSMRADIEDLKKNQIARWGRIPHVAADPASPPDGSVWIRSDDHRVRYQAAGATRVIGASRFANGGSSGTTSGATPSTVCTLSIPAQVVDGYLFVWATCLLGVTVNTDSFDVVINYNGSGNGADRVSGAGGGNGTAQPHSSAALAAATAMTLTLVVTRVGGTGVANFFADSNFNRLDALWIPA